MRMQVLSKNSERPVSKLAETNGFIDWLHRDKVDMEKVKHLEGLFWSDALKEQKSRSRIKILIKF